MAYNFLLKKNIHMYNHLITCTCGRNKYEAICESAPTKEETIIFWPDSFGVPPEEKAAMMNDFKEWVESQGFRYIIAHGER